MQQPERIIGRRLAARALAVTRDAGAAPRAAMLDLTRAGDAQPPAHVLAAAHAALDRGETHYTSGAGIPPLRRALAERSTTAGFLATPESIVVTNGGAEALYIALQTTLRPGERVLLGSPVMPRVREMIRFVGAEAAQLPLDPAAGWVAGADDVAAHDATLLLLASPSPVTGLLVAPERLARLLAAALEREMTVVLDRTLAWCCYDEHAAAFPRADLGARVLTTGSFSDAFGMSGWRVGYLSAPAAQLAASADLKVGMSICTSPISQQAALAALTGSPDAIQDRRAGLASTRDSLQRRVKQSGLDLVAPDAWPPLLVDTRAIDPDDRYVAGRLAERGVLVQPGSTFDPSLADFVRIRTDLPLQLLDAALDRLIAIAPPRPVLGEGDGR
jgi:aspartate aminotransferase